MAQVEVKNVAHSYDGKSFSLNPLNMIWEDGGTYALLGPSGCGKTTLLNIISGLLSPSKGQILMDGKDVTQKGPGERNIAQVFQFPVMYDSMTVEQNLRFPIKRLGLSSTEEKKLIDKTSAILGIEEILKRKAKDLPAHLKQLISLGRALVRPDVSAILLDEPLTVVDPEKKSFIRRKLKEVHAESPVTMIYVTHDQHEALTFAEKVLVMSEGTLLQVGTPEELYEKPKEPFVGRFIGSPGMNLWGLEVAMSAIANPDWSWDKATAHLNDQQAATIGIRPRDIEVLSPHQEQQHLSGSITSVEHQGQEKVFTIKTDHWNLKAQVKRDTPYQTGDRVGLRIPADHLHFFSGDAHL